MSRMPRQPTRRRPLLSMALVAATLVGGCGKDAVGPDAPGPGLSVDLSAILGPAGANGQRISVARNAVLTIREGSKIVGVPQVRPIPPGVDFIQFEREEIPTGGVTVTVEIISLNDVVLARGQADTDGGRVDVALSPLAPWMVVEGDRVPVGNALAGDLVIRNVGTAGLAWSIPGVPVCNVVTVREACIALGSGLGLTDSGTLGAGQSITVPVHLVASEVNRVHGVSLESAEGDLSAFVEVVTPPLGMLVVQLLPPSGVVAASGQTVRILGQGVDRTAVTDAAGAVAFEGLPLGRYTVEAPDLGVESATILSRNGQIAEIPVDEPGIGTLAVNVALDGGGTADFLVEVDGPNLDGPVVGTIRATGSPEAAGSRTFRNLRRGTYDIVILNAETTDFLCGETSRREDVAEIGQTLDVAFATCSIKGVVSGRITIEGDPPATPVLVTISDGETTVTTTTGPNGNYSANVLGAGRYTVTLSGVQEDAEFGTMEGFVDVVEVGSGARILDFGGAYRRTSVISGVVTTTPPVAGDVTPPAEGLGGVLVTLTGGKDGLEITTVTAPDGSYSFPGLRDGSYTVSVGGFDPGQYLFGTASRSVSVGVDGAGTASFGAAEAPATVLGTVRVNGLGLAGITVTIDVLEGPAKGAKLTLFTNDKGEVTFPDLPRGEYQVTISGWNAASVIFPSGAVQMVTLGIGGSGFFDFDGQFPTVVTQPGSIVGRMYADVNGNGVFDGGDTPFAGETVTLTGGASRTATTSATGQYSFPGLTPGSYAVSVTNPDPTTWTFASTSTTRSVGQSQTVTVDFRATGVVTPPGTIQGRMYADLNGNSVFDAGDTPFVGETVTLSGAASATATTSATGQYSFTGLAPGSYTVSITNPDPTSWTFAATSVTRTVGSGQTVTVDFLATAVVVGTGRIHGRVFRDPPGGPRRVLKNYLMTLVGPAGTLTTRTSDGGEFEFKNLPVGDYQLTCNTCDVTFIPASPFAITLSAGRLDVGQNFRSPN